MQKKDIVTLFETLHALYQNPTTELHYTTPFQLLIAVVMSAQATDKQVNKVTTTLFDRVVGPQDVVDMGLDAFMYAIRSIGLYKSKANNVYKLSCMMIGAGKPDFAIIKDSVLRDKAMHIYQSYGYFISPDITVLQKFPGVGEKTAKVVARVLYDLPVIAVDTHVHRVSNRLGLVKTKTPLQTSQILEKVVPKNYKSIAHHTLILFGRYHCVARKPKCGTCPFTGFCQYFKKLP